MIVLQNTFYWKITSVCVDNIQEIGEKKTEKNHTEEIIKTEKNIYKLFN